MSSLLQFNFWGYIPSKLHSQICPAILSLSPNPSNKIVICGRVTACDSALESDRQNFTDPSSDSDFGQNGRLRPTQTPASALTPQPCTLPTDDNFGQKCTHLFKKYVNVVSCRGELILQRLISIFWYYISV